MLLNCSKNFSTFIIISGSSEKIDPIYSTQDSYKEKRGYLHAFALNFIFKEETYQYVIPPSFGDEFLSESCQQQLTQLTKPWSLTWPKVK